MHFLWENRREKFSHVKTYTCAFLSLFLHVICCGKKGKKHKADEFCVFLLSEKKFISQKQQNLFPFAVSQFFFLIENLFRNFICRFFIFLCEKIFFLIYMFFCCMIEWKKFAQFTTSGLVLSCNQKKERHDLLNNQNRRNFLVHPKIKKNFTNLMINFFTMRKCFKIC